MIAYNALWEKGLAGGCAEGTLRSYLGHNGENNDCVYVVLRVSEGESTFRKQLKREEFDLTFSK